MLVDTHCHINIMLKKKFDIPLTQKQLSFSETIAKEAADNGVTDIINVGTSVIESRNCIQLAQKNKDMYAAVGIHPSDIQTGWNKDLKKIEGLMQKHKKIVAIGECGIDLYHHKHNLQQQKNLFKAQIELSLTHQLPLIIHMRDSTDELISSLETFKGEKICGVIHCFSGTQKFANYLFDLGFFIGIGGAITYPKNEALREVVQQSPLEKIILETDAPFLPPQNFRGKPNHPKHVAEIARYVAKLRAVSFDAIAQQTTKNAFNLFKLGKLEQ